MSDMYHLDSVILVFNWITILLLVHISIIRIWDAVVRTIWFWFRWNISEMGYLINVWNGWLVLIWLINLSAYLAYDIGCYIIAVGIPVYIICEKKQYYPKSPNSYAAAVMNKVLNILSTSRLFDENTNKILVNHLVQKLGVEEVNDLNFIREQDLEEVLKLIQIRKLLSQLRKLLSQLQRDATQFCEEIEYEEEETTLQNFNSSSLPYSQQCEDENSHTEVKGQAEPTTSSSSGSQQCENGDSDTEVKSQLNSSSLSYSRQCEDKDSDTEMKSLAEYTTSNSPCSRQCEDGDSDTELKSQVELDSSSSLSRQSKDEYSGFSRIELIQRVHIEEENNEVAGITCFGNAIYVVCYNSKKVHVFQLNDMRKEEIEIKKMDNPFDMTSNKFNPSILISDRRKKCLWKIEMPEKSISKKKVDGWPGGLSITPYGELLVVVQGEDDQMHLDIYRTSNMEQKESIPLPSRFVFTSNAVQLSNRNFIVSHYVNSSSPSVYKISELSPEGEVIRFYTPLAGSIRPIHIAVDKNGRVFVADYSAHDGGSNSVLQVNSQFNDHKIILDKSLAMIDCPARLCYSQEKQQLIVGHWPKRAGCMVLVSIYNILLS